MNGIIFKVTKKTGEVQELLIPVTELEGTALIESASSNVHCKETVVEVIHIITDALKQNL